MLLEGLLENAGTCSFYILKVGRLTMPAVNFPNVLVLYMISTLTTKSKAVLIGIGKTAMWA